MKPRSCDAFRLELSARLDDAVDDVTNVMLEEHLAQCAECSVFEESLHSLRRLLRLQPTENIPDLTAGIRARVAAERTARGRSELFGHLRAAGLAAAVTVLLFVSSSFPRFGTPEDIASAAEITRGIRVAARSLTEYRASFEIVERNFSRAVPARLFTATIHFQAPERLSLRVEDRTDAASPSYRPQSYELIATPRRWSAIEPSECASQPVYPCPAAGSPVRHGLVRRQPFDLTALVPTDIILPLESVASAGDLRLLGEREVMGHSTLGVEVSAAQAESLLGALDPFDVWRPMHPLDRVRIWLDSSTWFPLSVEIVAAASDSRSEWAARLGLDESSGETILQVSATSLADDLGQHVITPPRTPSAFDGGFTETPFAPLPAGPSFIGELDPYRSGRTAAGDRVAAYARGTSWLRVSSGPAQGPSIAALLQSDEVRTTTGFAYYAPASAMSSRRVDLYGRHVHMRIESNLPRSTLLQIAGSVQMAGLRQAQARSADALTRRASPSVIHARFPFADFPGYLPEGYQLAGSFMTSQPGLSNTISLYYRRAEIESQPEGIQITQARAFDTLPPTSEEPVVVEVGDVLGRWSVERGELEWIDDHVYRSITVPAFDLELALRIARSL